METEIKDEYLGGERKDILKHELIALRVALLAARESKDPSTQVGACIVSSDNRIISTGFNHNPDGWDSKTFPWRNDVSVIGEENTKYPYVIHAEMDAVSKCMDRESLKDSTIYVTLFPCVQCAKLIVSFGIKKVVYDEIRDSLDTICAKRLFKNSGVEIVSSEEIKNHKIRIKL